MGSKVRCLNCSVASEIGRDNSACPCSPPLPLPPHKNTIGTQCETSLHRDLKFNYVGSGQTEVEVAGFVADGVNAEGEFIEVQTGSFGPLKEKAHKLAAQGRLCIVYPIIMLKYIEVFDLDGKRRYRRKSPRRGNVWDIFGALIHAPELPLIHGLVIELALVDVSEQRVCDGKGSWRRKGMSIQDRKLETVHERIRLERLSDYLRFIPFTKDEEFTSATLGEKAGIGINKARKTLYVLNKLGIVKKTGKRSNAIVYQVALLRMKKPTGDAQQVLE